MTSSTFKRGRLPGLVPYAFVVVPLAYMTVFVFGPLIQQVWISFTDTRLMNPTAGDFIGLENYRELFSDKQFYTSFNITILYTILTVVLGVLVGTVSALAMDKPFKGRALLRTIMLFGWAVPSVAATLVWLWIFNGPSGVASDITEALGFGRIPWLTSIDWALTSIMFVTIWQVSPFVMLVMMAALQSVPEEVREAARIDGADALNVFRNVTLPCIMPTMQIVALLVAVWSIRRFEVIYLLTGGGPIGSTSTLVVQLRLTAFEGFDLGMASAYGVVGLALALAVAFVHFLFERRRAQVMSK